MFHQLFQYIGRATCTLIMDNINDIFCPHLAAGTNHPAHLLLHLRITPLDGVEIKAGIVFALHHRGSGAAAKTNPIGRTAHLDNDHLLFGSGFFYMTVVKLADAAGKHDRL